MKSDLHKLGSRFSASFRNGRRKALLLWLLLPIGAASAAELWSHLSDATEAAELRGVSARMDDSGNRRVLHLTMPELNVASGERTRDPRRGIGWISIAAPEGGWALERSQEVRVQVRNTGSKSAHVTLWVAASRGWSAVGDGTPLEPGQPATLTCNLRETYPDQTPKLDPRLIREIRIMIQRAQTASLEVSGLVAQGTAEAWKRPPGRIDAPDMMDGRPAAGKRVRYRLPGDSENTIYSALYLPLDWSPTKRFPVIVEFPGNIFFRADACWSTGRPEQCSMGYGISQGTGAIWISLPFVDREEEDIAEAGFGSREGEDTAAYTLALVEDLCTNWGADRENLILCGFSRGAIACGYIGLRNDRIAPLWKGFIACQHYDGSAWRQSRMEEAVLRAPRFHGKAIFQIDNSEEKYRPVVEATNPSVAWTWTKSNLGYHDTAMFLDDRPTTRQLRTWFRNLVATP